MNPYKDARPDHQKSFFHYQIKEMVGFSNFYMSVFPPPLCIQSHTTTETHPFHFLRFPLLRADGENFLLWTAKANHFPGTLRHVPNTLFAVAFPQQNQRGQQPKADPHNMFVRFKRPPITARFEKHCSSCRKDYQPPMNRRHCKTCKSVLKLLCPCGKQLSIQGGHVYMHLQTCHAAQAIRTIGKKKEEKKNRSLSHFA